MNDRTCGTQLDLIEKICPCCRLPESKVGELHEDDNLCAKCEEDWVEFCQECAKEY